MPQILLIILALLVSSAAHAQDAAGRPRCPAVSTPSGGMEWFYGFRPSDDLLSAWCRIQEIPGKVRFNILFPKAKAHRSWETSFDGETLPADQIVRIVQSLIPTEDGPRTDKDGMEFHRVLFEVYQAGAERTQDGALLGVPSANPASRELILWEPIVLRVRPIMLAGQEFALSVVLKPNLGMLVLGLNGMATDVRFLGWKGRMDLGNIFSRKCSDKLPYCEDLPDVPSFHAPWVVTGVRLDAEGDGMTGVASAILDHLIRSNPGRTSGTTNRGLDPSTGEGAVDLTDGATALHFRASGGPRGTSAISIVWEEKGHKSSTWAYLNSVADTYRKAIVPTPEALQPDAPPDSLDRL